jgi:uncharacterized membrane protein
MAVHNPVGSVVTLTTSATSGQSTQIDQQSDTLRIVATSGNNHVAIGSTPVAVVTDYLVQASGESFLSLGPVLSQRVTMVTKGTTTTIKFPEGVKGSPFAVGDTVSLSGKSGWTFEHAHITAITYPSYTTDDQRTTLTVSYNSSGWSGTWTDDDENASGDTGTLRRSFMVAARTDTGSGKIYVQQVQIAGEA